MGRFLGPDSIVAEPGDPQSLNRFAYAGNNPLRYSDPTGRACEAGAGFGGDWEDLYKMTGAPLYGVIAQIARAQATAKAALEAVLDSTYGPTPETHFQGIAAGRGDRGFAAGLADDYLYGELWGRQTPYSQQTGHFLTAVSFGYRSANALGAVRAGWIRLAIGHEMYPDPPTEEFRDKSYHAAQQLFKPSAADIASFDEAMMLDAAGQYAERDARLFTIFDPARNGPQADRLGNSMEDLRLTARGWRLGEMVASGQLSTSHDLANWIALNVAGG